MDKFVGQSGWCDFVVEKQQLTHLRVTDDQNDNALFCFCFWGVCTNDIILDLELINDSLENYKRKKIEK